MFEPVALGFQGRFGLVLKGNSLFAYAVRALIAIKSVAIYI